MSLGLNAQVTSQSPTWKPLSLASSPKLNRSSPSTKQRNGPHPTQVIRDRVSVCCQSARRTLRRLSPYGDHRDAEDSNQKSACLADFVSELFRVTGGIRTLDLLVHS